MHLTIDQVSRLLKLPTSTVHRWIRQGNIPVYNFRGEYVFLEKDLKKWARAHGIILSADSRDATTRDREEICSLLAAMKRGRVLNGIGGDDVSGVLRAAVAAAPLDAAIDRDELFVRLIEREELSTTGIGCGVAIPHPRSPLENSPAEPSVTTCFLEAPVDFNSIDGRPVFVLFLMLSPTPRIHLRLLSMLSHLIRDRSFAALLKERPSESDLFSRVEETAGNFDLPSRTSKPGKADKPFA